MMADTPTDRPATAERGELSLLLGGSVLVMRPSYEAIKAFEVATGKGLLQLAREAIGGTMRLGEVAQIACECIRAWGREVENRDATGANPKRIGELILDAEGGFHAALKDVAAVLSLASTGGYTSSGEVKPATKTKTTDGAPVAG